MRENNKIITEKEKKLLEIINNLKYGEIIVEIKENQARNNKRNKKINKVISN